MDKQSELLIRAALHDMANVLAGVQGILELADPNRPLAARDRDRLEAVVEEGMATLGRARHLAMNTLPEPQPQEWQDWCAQLAEDLRPMGVLYRCAFIIAPAAGSAGAPWPGARLRSYLRAAARQVLPYVHGGTLELSCGSEPDCWRILLRPVSLLPEGLTVDPGDRPGDISGRWAMRLGAELGIVLTCAGDGLELRVPRA